MHKNTRGSAANERVPLNDHRTKLDFLFLLEALLEEKNVRAAADRLGLSQPALSHALARLRVRFDDPLFVKTPAGMQPTPLAARLASSSKRALDVVRNEILNTITFEPRATARTFVVCLSDMGEAVHLHRILKRFGAEAPNARIRLVHLHVGEIAKQLETGDIDLAVGYYPELNGGLFQQTLFRCKQVWIVRADHTRIADTLSLRQFVETPHVVATPMAGASHYVDQALKKKKLRREVGLEVPHLSSVPNLIANSDFIALVPAELADLYGKLAALRVLDPSVKTPLLLIKQFWHRRFNADPQNQWLRSVVASTLAE
jgi:DNA-binding transcriptional LysR family regulator